MARDEPPRLLTTKEVAALFRVNRNTVTRWAQAGKLRSVSTPGRMRRFRESDVLALLEQDTDQAAGTTTAQEGQ
jgi:excisionase family DNA binding protein